MAGLRWPASPRSVRVYTDGAIRLERKASGLAAIVRDERGAIRHWWSCRAKSMTCNEAEYAAVIMALERLLASRPLRPDKVAVYCDSRVVVDQMQGRATVRTLGLRPVHARLRTLVTKFNAVTFHYIPRDQNRLADALANEVVETGFSERSTDAWKSDGCNE